jgi:AraC-like DNA-binding protein
MIPGAAPARGALPALPADPFFAETLFDALPDVVFFVKNPRGQYVVVNETLARRCGARSKADLLGKTAEEVFPPPLGASYAAQDRQVLAGRAIRDRLELHLYPDRSRGWCLTQKIPLRDTGGAVVGMAGLSRDLQRPDEQRADYRPVAAALEALQGRLDRPERVGARARRARMTMPRFERVVRRIFGLSPGQLLIKLRIDAASRALLETGDPITAIALACGYADHSAFSRQFKSAVGATPRQFREAAQRGADDAGS